jgi:hypothetical protein
MFLTIDSLSQINGYFSSMLSYDNNPFLYNQASSSIVNRNSLGLGYFPDSSNFGISFSSSLSLFGSYPERNYQNHKLSISESYFLDDSSKYEIAGIITGSTRLNSIETEYYNYYRLSADFEFNYYSDFANISILYSPENTSFSNYSDLNTFENMFTFVIGKSFQSGLSINFNTNYGFKDYYSINSKSYSNMGNGHGKGKMYRKMQITNNIGKPAIEYSGNLSQILSFQLTAAKSITEDIGISATYINQIFPNSNGVYISSGTIDLYNDREFYDDKYNYEANEFSTKLSFLILKNLSGNISSSYSIKKFVYDLNLIDSTALPNITRNDDELILSTSFKYNPDISFWFIENTIVNFNIMHISNKSNANMYNFKNTYFSISTILEF